MTESWGDGAREVASVAGESRFSSREEGIELIVVGGDAVWMSSDQRIQRERLLPLLPFDRVFVKGASEGVTLMT